jgi:hypothetical protein
VIIRRAKRKERERRNFEVPVPEEVRRKTGEDSGLFTPQILR